MTKDAVTEWEISQLQKGKHYIHRMEISQLSELKQVHQ